MVGQSDPALSSQQAVLDQAVLDQAEVASACAVCLVGGKRISRDALRHFLAAYNVAVSAACACEDDLGEFLGDEDPVEAAALLVREAREDALVVGLEGRQPE